MTTLADINRQIAKLQKQADAIKQREKKGIVASLRAAIDEYGITAAELGFGSDGVARRRGRPPASAASQPAASKAVRRSAGAKGSRGPVPARYRDADGNTWSGRGKRPNWFKAALAAGRTPEDLLINAPSSVATAAEPIQS